MLMNGYEWEFDGWSGLEHVCYEWEVEGIIAMFSARKAAARGDGISIFGITRLKQ